METYAVGSPDYKRAEETATKKMADLKADMELKRKDVMEKEAKLYFDTYQDIKRVVDDIAKRARIDLVLRYERQPIASPAGIVNPRDTLKLLNQPVIYDNGLDITDIVVKMLAPAGNSAQRPAPSTR
jgi:Skp family chaperone for outer membrane proteins